MAEGAVEDPKPSEKEEWEKDKRISVWSDYHLHVWKWEPSDDIRAWMYLSHGVGEYLGRHESLAKFLSGHGILVVGHDHVGHGKSDGERAYVEDFSTYVKDVVKHVQDLKEAYPGVPGFLMGHSMGGLVAALAAIEVQDLFSGVILSAAALELDPRTAGAFIKLAAKVLSRFMPRFSLKAVDPSLISSLPEEVEIYVNDPLVYHAPLKAKWAAEFMKAVDLAREGISKIKYPVLVFQGTNDHLVPFSASEFIMKHIGSKDKTFEVFEGDFHEVLHDKNQEKACKMIKDWIIAHKDGQQSDQQQEDQQQEDKQQEDQQQEDQQQEDQQHEDPKQEDQQQEDQQQEDQQQEDKQLEDQQQEDPKQEDQQQEDQQQEDPKQEDQQQEDQQHEDKQQEDQQQEDQQQEDKQQEDKQHEDKQQEDKQQEDQQQEDQQQEDQQQEDQQQEDQQQED